MLLSEQFLYGNPIPEGEYPCAIQADSIILLSLTALASYSMECRLVGKSFDHLL